MSFINFPARMIPTSQKYATFGHIFYTTATIHGHCWTPGHDTGVSLFWKARRKKRFIYFHCICNLNSLSPVQQAHSSSTKRPWPPPFVYISAPTLIFDHSIGKYCYISDSHDFGYLTIFTISILQFSLCGTPNCNGGVIKSFHCDCKYFKYHVQQISH